MCVWKSLVWCCCVVLCVVDVCDLCCDIVDEINFVLCECVLWDDDCKCVCYEFLIVGEWLYFCDVCGFGIVFEFCVVFLIVCDVYCVLFGFLIEWDECVVFLLLFVVCDKGVWVVVFVECECGDVW